VCVCVCVQTPEHECFVSGRWLASDSYHQEQLNLEEQRERGEGRGGGEEKDWGFCGVVGFPTGWHRHFVSLQAGVLNLFVLWNCCTEVQTADCNHGFELGVVRTED
jgi:hypothetical protein